MSLLGHAEAMPIRTEVLIYDHFEELDALGPFTVLNRAGFDITSGGVTSGIDMALWLAEKHFGRDVADSAAAEIEHRRDGRVWRATEAALER
jgi:putative intracellular protease/amidase